MSYREETIDIISIAQHASPNVSGQIEFPCAQRTAFSTVVSISLSSRSAPSSCSKTPGPLPPDVHIREREDRDEEGELREAEPAQRLQNDTEWIEKDDLDIEDDEEHRRQVEADREAVRVGWPL